MNREIGASVFRASCLCFCGSVHLAAWLTLTKVPLLAYITGGATISGAICLGWLEWVGISRDS
jgi:hypothetical protein